MEHTVTTLPTARQPGCPFDPPKELIQARELGADQAEDERNCRPDIPVHR